MMKYQARLSDGTYVFFIVDSYLESLIRDAIEFVMKVSPYDVKQSQVVLSIPAAVANDPLVDNDDDLVALPDDTVIRRDHFVSLVIDRNAVYNVSIYLRSPRIVNVESDGYGVKYAVSPDLYFEFES